MLVATCRDDDVPEQELAAPLGRLDRCRHSVRRVHLGGLEAADVVAMVTESLGTAAAEPVRDLAP